MAANPLTYSELEAFERKALVRLTAWQSDLLMRIDDAVLGAWASDSKPKNARAKRDAGPLEIPASNTKGVAAFFRDKAAKLAARAAAQPPTPKGAKHGPDPARPPVQHRGAGHDQPRARPARRQVGSGGEGD